MEKQLYSVLLTRNEREALQRLVESAGHKTASTWLRQVIAQSEQREIRPFDKELIESAMDETLETWF
jgi:hypothetical protein